MGQYLLPSGKLTKNKKKLWNITIEIVSFPMKTGGSFHSHVKLPEAIFHTEKTGMISIVSWDNIEKNWGTHFQHLRKAAILG